ncbi:hypothetical protein [Roseivirga sp.]|uniref:hypothetical protein n=1 Tax=Roseivirga sp. TaxID=1964215 RepID=UPI003B52B1EC
MFKRFVIALFLMLSVPVLAQQEDLQTVYQAAMDAYDKQDYDAFLEQIRKADELRPNHPAIVPKLAAAWSLTGRKIRAVQTLKQMMLMDATFNFVDNPDFDNIRDHKNYEDLVEMQEELARVEVHDEVYRVINAGMLHPESFVLMDNGEIILGSIREKKLVKVDTNGLVSDWIEVPYSVLGMKYVESTGQLWVASAAFPEMKDFSQEDQGKSMIIQIDVASGRIVQGVQFDDGSIIGDLVLDSEQRIWHSNSTKPYLIRNVTDTAQYYGPFSRKYFDLDGTHFNLQGLTLDDTEQFLYFSDYISGLYRINMNEDDAVEKLFVPEDILLKGIDGLYYYNNTLIAIHNGTKPYRVMQYFLNETGLTIDMERVINRGGESLGEPTLGQVKDGYFYYLANSPWGAYDEDKNLIAEKVRPIEIRRIKL